MESKFYKQESSGKWFESFRFFLSRLFRKKSDKERPFSLNEKEVWDRELFDSLKYSVSNNSLYDNVQSYVLTWGQYYTRLGDRDGQTGSRNFGIYYTAKTHATLMTNRIVSTIQGDAEGMGFLVGQKDESLAEYRTQYAKSQSRVQDHINEKISNHAKYNLLNGLLYVAIGVTMTVSDGYISMNLMSFFGVGMFTETGTPDWRELIFFSLGIALCTILFKIFYDQYMHQPLGYVQLKIKKTADEGANKVLLWIEAGARFLVKMSILIGLLWLLCSLARFRAAYILEKNDVKIMADAVAHFIDLNQALIHSLIGITVIIPIISGIALSAGLHIFFNISGLLRAHVSEWNFEKKCHKHQIELQELKYKWKKLNQYYEEWKKQDRIELNCAFLVQSYNQGFRASYKQNHGNDLYKLAEEYRNEMLNHSIANKLNP